MEKPQNQRLLNGLIFGGTGAVGREFIKHAFNDPKWAKLYVVTRRSLPEFERLKSGPDGNRLRLILNQDIADFETIQTSLGEDKIDGVFNFLGSRVGRGKELFMDIDKTKVVQSCDFAHRIKASLFSHITSKGANPKSWFFYLQVKGECEQELLKSEMENISILRPGAITNRDNDKRFGEKILSWIPFISKISSSELAQRALNDANTRLGFLVNGEGEEGEQRRIYEHGQILKL